MTRTQTRSHFHSSRLIHALADLSLLDAVESGSAFAEKLGLWVNFTDAITLSAVHNANSAAPATPLGATSGTGLFLGKLLSRVRVELVNSINRSASSQGGKSGIELPVPDADALSGEPAYEPYLRYHQAYQREMESKLRPLRHQVRGVLGKASHRLRKLAALDAALDGILNERESKLLAVVPVLLEKRFRQLFTSHQQNLVVAQQADSTDLWLQEGGWLAVFCQEMRSVLLAELDLRMQASLGLVEAFNIEMTHNNE